MKHCKKYNAAAALIDASKEYTVDEASALIKKTSTTKFDSTIDISFALNVDPTKADQLIRGTLALPHGNGKTKTHGGSFEIFSTILVPVFGIFRIFAIRNF